MTRKVLIIDDEVDLVSLMEQRLSHFYKVITANDGESGLKKVMEEKPDLIITDINMPNMNGYQLIQKIKSNLATAKIPILLLTVESHTNAIYKAQEMGATDYVIKPINFEELPAIVQRYI